MKREKAVTVPIEELFSIRKEMSQKQEVATSLIKHYASEIGLDEWSNSLMPSLIQVYSAYTQIVEFIDIKLSSPENAHPDDPSVVIMTEMDLMVVMQALGVADSLAGELSRAHSLSLEMH